MKRNSGNFFIKWWKKINLSEKTYIFLKRKKFTQSPFSSSIENSPFSDDDEITVLSKKHLLYIKRTMSSYWPHTLLRFQSYSMECYSLQNTVINCSSLYATYNMPNIYFFETVFFRFKFIDFFFNIRTVLIEQMTKRFHEL